MPEHKVFKGFILSTAPQILKRPKRTPELVHIVCAMGFLYQFTLTHFCSKYKINHVCASTNHKVVAQFFNHASLCEIA